MENEATESSDGNSTSKKGINIQEALSILSLRAQKGSNIDHAMKDNKIDPNLKQMGQTIDFVAASSSSSSPPQSQNEYSQSSPFVTQEREETARQIQAVQQQQQHTTKYQDLKDTLSQQSPSSLLQTLFQLQQQRVSTYQKFNQSLDVVLQSKNFTNYTSVATNITAAFVVISNSIMEIQRIFREKHGRKDISGFIKRLQGYEKDKLHLTAALHLELMREQNDDIDFGVGGAGSGNEKIASLLRESIVSLQGRIADCVENINEVMEELRYAADDIS